MSVLSHPLRTLLPFWLFLFLFKVPAALHYTLMPILAERVFPVWLAGLLIGGAAGVQMLLDVPAGYLLDRFGYVRTLLVSTTCFLFGALLLLFGASSPVLIGSLVLATIGWLFFAPGMDAYVLLHAPSSIAGRFMAMRDVVTSAGVVTGMLLLPFLTHAQAPFIAIILAIPFLLSLVALLHAPLDRASVRDEIKIAHQSWYIRRHFFPHVLHAMKKLNPVSTILFLQQLSATTFYGVLWFVIPLMIARMATTGVLSFSMGVFDFSVLFTGFFIGRISDHSNKRWLIFWGMLLFAVSALLLGFSFGILFLLFGFLATTGDEMANVSLWAWLDRLDKDHAEDALVTGVLSLSKDLGWMIGPILAGLLFEPLGPTFTILLAAGFLFGTWIVSSVLLGHPDEHHPVHSRTLLPSHHPRRQPHR